MAEIIAMQEIGHCMSKEAKKEECNETTQEEDSSKNRSTSDGTPNESTTEDQETSGEDSSIDFNSSTLETSTPMRTAKEGTFDDTTILLQTPKRGSQKEEHQGFAPLTRQNAIAARRECLGDTTDDGIDRYKPPSTRNRYNDRPLHRSPACDSLSTLASERKKVDNTSMEDMPNETGQRENHEERSEEKSACMRRVM